MCCRLYPGLDIEFTKYPKPTFLYSRCSLCVKTKPVVTTVAPFWPLVFNQTLQRIFQWLWNATISNAWDYYTPRSTKLKGVYWLNLVRLSVCPSADRIGSTLYLIQYLPGPFHIYISYQKNSEGVSRVKLSKSWKNFGKFFEFVTLTLSCFDLGSNMNWSIVWVIVRRRGVSSEHWRSNCSSYICASN